MALDRLEIAARPAQENAFYAKLEARLAPWSSPMNEDDYHFAWATTVGMDTLSAGTIYEYARESRKLRGLLALHLLGIEKVGQR